MYYIIRVHKVDSTITITTAPKMREKENYLEKQPCFDARKDASMKEKEGRGQNSKHFTQNIAKNKVLDEWEQNASKIGKFVQFTKIV